MIKKSEYGYVADAQNIGCALECLRRITPERKGSVINEKEFQKIVKTLYGWERKLYENICIESEKEINDECST